MAGDVVIKLDHISKVYKLFASKKDRMKEALHPLKKRYHNEFYALNDISLEVKRGEILGIVGVNGSGKSTLLKLIAGIIQPSGGSVSVQGNVVPLLELGSGFNPEFSGLENIYFYNSILGKTRRETDAIIGNILDFAEIGDFIHQPLKTYSSGMKARLSFAVSVNVDPDILIVDEILSVGDELFRRKSFSRIEEFFHAGKTILFVSHNDGNINQLCSRAIMLHQGRIVLNGLPKVVTMNYNKFIFSQSTERLGLLNLYKGVNANADFLETPSKDNKEKTKSDTFPSVDLSKGFKAYFIPNYLPKSTVITQIDSISISNLRMETIEGKPVNALVQHEEYIFSYTAAFSEHIGFINFGVGFRTEKGIPLSWRVVPDKNHFLPSEVKQGDKFELKWKFTCLFMPGTYYINTAIKRDNNHSEEIVFRGQDIFVFRVLGSGTREKGGLFDAGITLSLREV